MPAMFGGKKASVSITLPEFIKQADKVWLHAQTPNDERRPSEPLSFGQG